MSVPIYQGGAEYSLIRQSKETLAQQRLVLEQTRDQTRANTVTAWGQLVAGKAQVASAQSQVTASEIALNGVREEAKAGQRTTLDVLNAQQALVNARVALVTAQHDRVVASYARVERGRTAVAAGAQSADHDLRPERALSAGARQLVRRSHARRPLIAASPIAAHLAGIDCHVRIRADGSSSQRFGESRALLAIICCPDVPFAGGSRAIRAAFLHPSAARRFGALSGEQDPARCVGRRLIWGQVRLVR